MGAEDETVSLWLLDALRCSLAAQDAAALPVRDHLLGESNWCSAGV